LPNIISTVYDVTVPEVRSTALAVQYLIGNAGAASTGMHPSILIIYAVAWAFCTLFLIGAVYLIPKDIQTLRQQMREHAQSLAAGTAPGRPVA